MKREEIKKVVLLKQLNRLEIAMSHLERAEQLAYKDITIYSLLQPVKKYFNEEIKKCIEKSSKLK